MTRIRRTKAMATVLAMIADAFSETVPPRENDEWLSQTAADFCAGPRVMACRRG
jgi:hypothetical protein